MGEPRAVQVALVVDEHLGLVDEAAERGGMHDAVAVALVFASGKPEAGSGMRRPRECDSCAA